MRIGLWKWQGTPGGLFDNPAGDIIGTVPAGGLFMVGHVPIVKLRERWAFIISIEGSNNWHSGWVRYEEANKSEWLEENKPRPMLSVGLYIWEDEFLVVEVFGGEKTVFFRGTVFLIHEQTYPNLYRVEQILPGENLSVTIENLHYHNIRNLLADGDIQATLTRGIADASR